MTPEERQMLTDLAQKITQAPAPARDPEADELIRTQIGSRPDALYMLTQTVLIQNIALDHAKQQIQQLEQRAAQSSAQQAPTSFLGSLFGSHPSQPAAAPAQTPGYGQAPPPPPYAPAQSVGGGAPSFLRSAATTAAGVAAGALAFEGIRSMFGGGEHLGGFGGGMHGSGFLSDAPVPETIINNYYDSPDQTAGDISDDTSTQDGTDDSTESVDDSDYSSDDSGSSGDDLV
jgi:uncharacterized protein